MVATEAAPCHRPSNRPHQVVPALRSSGEQLHRSSMATSPSTWSTWAPHPAHDGLLQVEQVIRRHMNDDPTHRPDRAVSWELPTSPKGLMMS